MSKKTLLVALALALAAATPSAHDTEEAKIVASDGAAGDLFGSAVAIDGTTLVVGAPAHGGTGAAYVFVYNGTIWVEEQKLVPSDGLAGDLFGTSVAVLGDDVVVGAPGHDSAATDAGAAYVFLRSTGSWSEVTKLTGTGATAGDSLGHSVSLDGDTFAAGAPRLATGTSGSAFVFLRTLGVWAQEAEVSATVGSANDELGFAVKLEADTLVVGAPAALAEGTSTGAAYIFERSGTVWTQGQKLLASDRALDDRFGCGLGSSDGLITVGANQHDSGGVDAGALYNFRRVGGLWTQTGKAEGKNDGDSLGTSVANSLNFYLGGAHLNDGTAPDAGQARLYTSNTLIQIFVVNDPITNHFLGTSLAAQGCLIAAGAPGDADNGVDSGAVYTFLPIDGSAVQTNGTGLNPEIMLTTVPPVIGEDWEVQVNMAPVPGGVASQVMVYAALFPVPFPSAFGEVLVDITTPKYLQDLAFGGGVNLHQIPIPNDPSLLGLTSAAQTVIFGSGGIGLTNAEMLTIGCPH